MKRSILTVVAAVFFLAASSFGAEAPSNAVSIEDEAARYVHLFENATNAFHAEFQGQKYGAWRHDVEELTGPLSEKKIEIAKFITGYYMVKYRYEDRLSKRRYDFLIQLTAEGVGKKRFSIAYYFYTGSRRFAKYAVYAYREISSYVDEKWEEYAKKYEAEQTNQ